MRALSVIFNHNGYSTITTTHRYTNTARLSVLFHIAEQLSNNTFYIPRPLPLWSLHL